MKTPNVAASGVLFCVRYGTIISLCLPTLYHITKMICNMCIMINIRRNPTKQYDYFSVDLRLPFLQHSYLHKSLDFEYAASHASKPQVFFRRKALHLEKC